MDNAKYIPYGCCHQGGGILVVVLCFFKTHFSLGCLASFHLQNNSETIEFALASGNKITVVVCFSSKH